MPMRSLPLLIVLMLPACSLLIPRETESRLKQQQRESIVGRATTEVVSQSKADLPVVEIETRDGTKLRVQHGESRTDSRTEADERAATSESLLDMSRESVPLFVKLIGGAVGLGLLALVVFWVIRRIKQGAAGAAAAAAFHTADQSIAAVLNGLKNQAMSEPDPAKALMLSTQISALEKSRGKLAAEAGGTP